MQGSKFSCVTKQKPAVDEIDGTGQAGVGRGDDAMVVDEQLVERTCDWCGVPVTYAGRGRPPRYCRPSHRRRASELRTAQARAERPVAEDGRSTEPVREVVKRTVIRHAPAASPAAPCPAQRLSGQPYTLPEDAVEWIEALAALRREALTNPRVAPFREHIARACERTADTLRDNNSPTSEPDPAAK